MGQTPFDKYSLLHFLSGVGAKYVGLDFYTWCVVHLVFEATENTESGIKFINDNFPWWPGGGKDRGRLLEQYVRGPSERPRWVVGSQEVALTRATAVVVGMINQDPAGLAELLSQLLHGLFNL